LKNHALLYGFVIFVSAFLLFQVQPLIGRFILPWFGSGASIWSTTLVFFQLMLLAGYGYAHILATRLSHAKQVKLHCALLLLAFLALPIIPSAFWRELDGGNPTFLILMLLLATVGVPYFLLASTSPLLQRWFADRYQGRSPYRLYAVSNAGSLMGLLTYPFLVEPFLRMREQAWLWSFGYAVFVLFAVRLAFGLSVAGMQASVPPPPTPPASAHIPRRTALLWILLSMLPSALLVATTSRMAQDVPAVPFLFVLQLSIYLLTFIIAFDGPRWYWRPLFLVLLGLGVAGVYYSMLAGPFHLQQHMIIFSLALFAGCMCCHGELARRKPEPQQLTYFYLLIAFGGALGGTIAALLAPVVFSNYWEYEFSLIGIAVLVPWLVIREMLNRRVTRGRLSPLTAAWLGNIFAVVLIAGMTIPVGYEIQKSGERVIVQVRSFYGVLSVMEHADTQQSILYHGNTLHGSQSNNPNLMRRPTAYYGPTSGVGKAILYHPNYGRTDSQFRLGVVGLGVGTLSAYQNPPAKLDNLDRKFYDYVIYYEIDAAVQAIADEHFSYLQLARNRRVNVAVVLGDARNSMERQLDRGEAQQLDVLVVDAFSGDSVPMHLLTKEVFGIYLEHMREGGIVAFHISNRYLKLQPVIEGLAQASGMQLRYFDNKKAGRGQKSSKWVLITNNEDFLRHDGMRSAEHGGARGEPILWTDDFSSLLDVL